MKLKFQPPPSPVDMKIFDILFLHWNFIYQTRIRNKINRYFTNYGLIFSISVKFHQILVMISKNLMKFIK